MGICSSGPSVQDQIHERLKSTPFSYRMTDQSLYDFASKWELIKVQSNDSIPGFSVRDFFVVDDGEFDLRYKGIPICVKGKGDFIGLPFDKDGLVAKETTVNARTNSSILKITRELLDQYIKDTPTAKQTVVPLLGQTTRSLSKVECFEGIDEEKLSVLNMMFKYVCLKEGDVLFKEESLGSSLYVVLEGAVKAVARIRGQQDAEHPDGEQKEQVQTKMLHEFLPSEIFGEISLIMDIPRTAAIVASRNSLLLELTRSSFRSLMKMVDATDLHLNRIIKVRIAQHFRKYKVPFFAAIPDEKYSILASYCEIVQLPADQVVFKEGDIGLEFYMIAHGECKVTVKKKEKDGKVQELELTRMGPGKYFGEIALVQETTRTATVNTTKRTVLLSITKKNFEKFFMEAPEAIADFEIKLARYNVQLRSVMYHPIGLDYFTKHVKTEFSEENIEFWKECRDFRHFTYADLETEEQHPRECRNKSIIMGSGDLPVAADELKVDSLDVSSLDRAVEEARKPKKSIPGDRFHQDFGVGFELFANADKVLDVPGFKNLMTLCHLNLDDLEDEDLKHVMEKLGAEKAADGTQVCKKDKFVENLVQIHVGHRGKRPSFVTGLLWKISMILFDNNLGHAAKLFETSAEESGRLPFFQFQIVVKQLGFTFDRDVLKKKFDDIDNGPSHEIGLSDFIKFVIKEKQNTERFNRLLRRRAIYIYNEYVSGSAPKQINILGPTRKAIRKDIVEGHITLNTFDRAEQEIMALLSTDTFARFKQSSLFQSFLDAVSSYTHVKKEEKGDKKATSSKGVKKQPRLSTARPTTTVPPASASSSSSASSASASSASSASASSPGSESGPVEVSIEDLMSSLGSDKLFSMRVGGKVEKQRVQVDKPQEEFKPLVKSEPKKEEEVQPKPEERKQEITDSPALAPPSAAKPSSEPAKDAASEDGEAVEMDIADLYKQLNI